MIFMPRYWQDAYFRAFSPRSNRNAYILTIKSITSVSHLLSSMGLPFCETIDCIQSKISRKRQIISKRLSQSCHGSLKASICTTSSEFSGLTDEKTIDTVDVLRTCSSDEDDRLILNVLPYELKDVRLSLKSICVTVSAISHLYEEDLLLERCLSCSLDGLKVRHPRCDSKIHRTKTNGEAIADGSCAISPNCGGRHSTSNLSATFLSSVTLHSTWPRRKGDVARSQELPRESPFVNIDQNIPSCSDSLEVVSCDESEKIRDDESQNISIGSILQIISDGCSEKALETSGSGSGSELIGAMDAQGTYGICEDWDDDHLTDENDMSMDSIHTQESGQILATAKEDLKSIKSLIEVSNPDVDVYTVSEKSSEKVPNEVMSNCDWSFLQENKKMNKMSKKKKSLLACKEDDLEGNNSVSSCSLSDDDDDDDDNGSVDQYFMNEISKKKKRAGKQVIIGLLLLHLKSF